MRCLQCGTDNREGRRFCAACGVPLVRTCPGCGFSNEPGENFCGGCGLRLALPPEIAVPEFGAPDAYTPPHLAERILAGRSGLAGERKQVTVMFADVQGSLELLAGLDPEEARNLLEAIVKRMMEVVHRYEGTVNQVMGDGIMALFGAPIAHEAHAVRAGYAALKMQEAMAAYADQCQQQYGVCPQIRVGLNAGEVVVGNINNDLAMDYTAIGPTTHLAARMEQLASAGAIVVTKAFAHLAEGYLRFKSLGLVPVKGLADPVEVFELLDAQAPRTRFQVAAARGLTRFVGRQAELQALGNALERAGTGQGQMVAVIGESGVGKSRLFYEFVHLPLTQDWLILESDTTSYGKDNSYLPLRDLLTAYFQIDDRDDEQKIREKVDKHLSLDMVLWHIQPEVLALLDVTVDDPEWQALDPRQRRLRMIDGVKRLLLRRSQRQPVLVIFENLHWIDAGTQAFLDSLVESLPTARLLLLVNYRLEYQHGWGNKAYYTQLRLDPLSSASAQEILHVLLGDDPGLEPLKQQLMARTDGNPFFLEESVRTLVETQVLVGERGNYRLAQALPVIQVPATVQAVLAARIDRLPPEEKRLLQTTAVLGKDVPFPLLQAIVDMSEDALYRGLTHLQATEFLHEASLFPELEYTFKHALTHEVAYSSLLQRRRRALHARIVEAIETRYAERLATQVERLAHHAFHGEIWDKAVVYFRQAGAKAASRSAYREAVTCFEQALAALQHLPESPQVLEQAFELRMELRPWLVPLLDYQKGLDNLRAAEAIAEAQGDLRRRVLICSHMSEHCRMAGDSEAAVAYGERALAIATELGDFSLQVLANQRLGHACHAVGDYRRAIQLLQRNVVALSGELIRERFGAGGPPSGRSRSNMVFPLIELGEFAEAVSVGEEAVRIANEADAAHGQVMAVHAVGLAYLCKGDFDRAIPLLAQTFQRCQVERIPLGTRLLASALGYAYALSGRLGDGVALLEQAVQQAEAHQVFFRYALWLAWLGEAYLLAGRTDQALELTDRAVAHASTHKEAGHQAYALRLRGEIAAYGSPLNAEQAEVAYRQALALAGPLGMRPLQAHCRFGLGTLYHKMGLLEQARAELLAAMDLFGAMEMTFWLRRASALLGGGT